MDGCNLESRHRLHKDRPRLRQLLRRPIHREVPRHARPPFRERLRRHAPTRTAVATALVEEATADLRELDQRPLPQGHTSRVHRSSVRHHGGRRPSRLPATHEAKLLDARLRCPTLRTRRSARTHLVWRLCRGPRSNYSTPSPSTDTSAYSLPLHRTTPRPCRQHRPRWSLMGYRRRRERSQGPPNARRVGTADPRSLPTLRHPLLLRRRPRRTVHASR